MNDLEWLARNVHEWNDDFVFVNIAKTSMIELPEFVSRFSNKCCDGCGCYTKPQWLAKRAELQNKPSWDDAPEWANWLGQDSNGYWHWYNIKPVSNISASQWMFNGDNDKTKFTKTEKGQVLGNWQDTLEERPVLCNNNIPYVNNLKERPVMVNITNDLKKAVSNAIDDLNTGKIAPQGGIEWNGEGLPPVGCECRIQSDDEDWQECLIVLVDGGEVVYRPVDKSLRVAHFCDLSVKPLKTERDMELKELENTFSEMFGANLSIQEKALFIYEAGYRKTN